MIIGVPKEIMQGEKRVSATPETVSKLVKDGATVLIEKSAGEGSFYNNEEYKAAGAEIVDDVAEIYQRADVILKVKEPIFNSEKNVHEVDMMHEGQYLITFLHPAAPANHEMIKNMAAKGVIGLTLDGVPRISRAQNMDALTSMSTCAGYKGMLLAVNELSKFTPQIFTAVGMIKPAEVYVIGSGVGGLQAIATAKRLGAVVYASDIRPDAAEQAMSLGAKVIDTTVPADIAVGKGGYANALPEEWLIKEREAIKDTVSKMDIVFLGALVPGMTAPILLTEEMVKSMAPGSVIVDISIDQGGNCAITDPGEVVVKHDVTIIGIKNIPGMLPTSSTWMFANNVYNLVKYLTKDGKIALDRSDEIVASILVTIDGEIVHEGTKKAMNL
ncbi:MAG: NAD(P) transhydrogenase subunit alpha [Clostridiales bacterium]|nr:NAD(P) transhydrogenase subunit alpha [Clostridiales bacterium]